MKMLILVQTTPVATERSGRREFLPMIVKKQRYEQENDRTFPGSITYAICIDAAYDETFAYSMDHYIVQLTERLVKTNRCATQTSIFCNKCTGGWPDICDILPPSATTVSSVLICIKSTQFTLVIQLFSKFLIFCKFRKFLRS